MEFKEQNNSNQGDVYNIEKIDTIQNITHQNINPYLVEENVVSGKDVESCKTESSIIILAGVIGFFADISELFPSFDIPWWLWLLGALGSFFYIVIKYGDAFAVSSNKPVQLVESGKLIIATGKDFTKNRSEAPCIYPNCSGFIMPIDTPSEYDGPYKIMGKCSVSELQHGYVIDNNLQAYKADIYSEFNNLNE